MTTVELQRHCKLWTLAGCEHLALDHGGAAGEARHLAGVAHARAEAAQRGLVAPHLPQRVRVRLAPQPPPAQGRCVRSCRAAWYLAVRARLE
jgi:hypothetical protein